MKIRGCEVCGSPCGCRAYVIVHRDAVVGQPPKGPRYEVVSLCVEHGALLQRCETCSAFYVEGGSCVRAPQHLPVLRRSRCRDGWEQGYAFTPDDLLQLAEGEDSPSGSPSPSSTSAG